MTQFWSAECDECGWFPEKFEDKDEMIEAAEDHAEGCAGKDAISVRAWG